MAGGRHANGSAVVCNGTRVVLVEEGSVALLLGSCCTFRQALLLACSLIASAHHTQLQSECAGLKDVLQISSDMPQPGKFQNARCALRHGLS